MPDRDDLRMFLGVGAVVVTLGVGTCSTNSRIDEIDRRMNDGFQNVNRRIDDTNRRMDDGFENINQRMDDGFENVNRRMDDMNRRIDDLQVDVRELRTLVFETLKNEQAPAN